MPRWIREHKPEARWPRRGRAQEQQLAIGRVKRLRFMRIRRQERQVLESLGPLWGRADRAMGKIKPPLPDAEAGDSPTKSVRSSLLSATLCLAVAALLVSGKIVEIADRLPLGPDRERWLEVANDTDRLANGLSLNRPYDLLRDLRGAGDEVGQQIDVISDVEDLRRLGLDGTAEQPPDRQATAPADEPAPVPGEPASAAPGEPEALLDEPDAQPEKPEALLDEPDALPDEHDVATTTTTTAATADAATTTSSTTTTVPEAPPTYIRPVPVSAEAPLSTWVAGDSQAFHLGHGMRRDGRLKDVMETTLDQRHSTGLARPGYFNWPVHFYAIATHYQPEVVVVTLGSNDWQSMTAPEGHTLSRGSDEWRAEWRRRLGVTFDVLEAPHRQVIWVGLPPTRSDEFREGYEVMNQLAAEAVAARDFVTMIDIWDLFGGDEPYRDAVPPPGDPEGRPVDVRQQDGVHLNQAGARWVVDLITDEIEQIIARISPEVTTPARPEPG